MSRPAPDDFIDAHTHGSVPSAGIFSVENLMAHENRVPVPADGVAYTAGIHPWYLDEANKAEQLEYIRQIAADQRLIALGEAGFDRLRGPSAELQRSVFGEQVKISEEAGKPLIIHCVRWWEELLSARRRCRPGKPWLVHGFRGKKELGLQLISAGMYLSFWFDFIIRPESAALVKALPSDRIFLETDGAGVDIRDIYGKVAWDLTMSVDELKKIIFDNYMRFFVNE
jgi:TatD DNase family protein